MEYGWNRTQKPSVGTLLDRGNQLASGIQWCAPMWEGGSSTCQDIIRGNNLTLAASTLWSPGSSPVSGTGFLSATSTEGATSGPWPVNLQQAAGPWTFVLGFSWNGTTHGSYAPVAGLMASNQSGQAQPAILIRWHQTGQTLDLMAGNGTQIFTTTNTISANKLYVIVATVYGVTTAGASALYVFSVGQPVSLWGSGNGANQNNTWVTSTSGVGFGSIVPGSANGASYTNTYFSWIYNRILSLPEIQAIAVNPWRIFEPSGHLSLVPSPVYIGVSPTSIYANYPINQVLTLTGFGTTWVNGTTTFTESGVSGVTKQSQTVSSTIAGTLTVSTASSSSTGTLIVSDGTNTGKTSVITPSFTISPSAIPANHTGHITLTLTGSGVDWVSNTFMLSGVSNITKISQNISSITSATVVITTGSGTGTLSISDGTYSATTSVNSTTFTLSPSSVTYSVPTPIVATGSTGSLWTTETASTLFTVPSTGGATLTSIVVNSNTNANFTLNPGTNTGSLVITETPVGVTTSLPINGQSGSLEILGNWTARTGTQSLLANQPIVSISFFIRYNSFVGTATNRLVDTASSSDVVGILTNSTQAKYGLYNTSGSYVGSYLQTISPGQIYHMVLTWNNNGGAQRWKIYQNGILQASGATLTNQGNTGSNWLQFGSEVAGSNNISYQISNFAIWNSYELTLQDILNLRDGTYIPGTLIGSVTAVLEQPTSWWLLGYTNSGTPSETDPGFTDYGTGGNNLTVFNTAPTSSLVQYAGPITYIAPALTNAYISKSGQLAIFLMTANGGTTSTPIGGINPTVSVARNSTLLTTNSPQPQNDLTPTWINSGLTISGDSSSTTYTIVEGYGTNWIISPPYAGSSNAVNASANIVQAEAITIVTSVYTAPTIQVQFGGTGSFQTVHALGPYWSPTSSQSGVITTDQAHAIPFIAWLLQCGPVSSIFVQNPGANYSSPSASASGGSGSGLTFGTPTMAVGVTSFTGGLNAGSGYGPAIVVFSGGSPLSPATATISVPSTPGPVTSITLTGGGYGYGSTPTATIYGGSGIGATVLVTVTSGVVTGVSLLTAGTGYQSGTTTIAIAAPSFSVTGVLTNGSSTVTSISTTGLAPGMYISGTGNPNNSIASIGSGTITLSYPALVSGSTSLTIVGKQAMAKLVFSAGQISAINVFSPGSGYNSQTPAVTIGGVGSGAGTVTTVTSNVISSIPITNHGSNYISPPTISVSDGGSGSGCVAVAEMGGIQPSDVVTYTVPDNWCTTLLGPPNQANNASITNYSGQNEPGLGGFYNFGLSGTTPRMPIGMNYADAVVWYAPHSPVTNWMTRVIPGPSGNIVTVTPDGRPLTISGTSGSPSQATIYNNTTSNGIDNSSVPPPIANGVNGNLWTYIYDDYAPSLSMSPLSFAMQYGAAATITGNSGPVSTGTETTGVTGITLGAMGSGYTDVPTVTITGGNPTTNATAYVKINANGQVYWVGILSPGFGYMSTPTITITGFGTGATVTATIGSVMIGVTWQWSVVPTVLNQASLLLNFWNSSGIGTYQYTGLNEFLFGPESTAAAYPSLPARTVTPTVDTGALDWLTTSTPKYPACIRFMGSEMVNARVNVVDPSDLKSAYDYTWYQQQTSNAYGSVNPTGTRTISITTVRTYAISTNGVTSISIGTSPATGGTGYVIATPPSVTIAAPGTGVTATAVAIVSGIGTITITNGGSGYGSTPTVTFGAPPGSSVTNNVTATGTVNMSGGSVTSITMTNNGFGYTSTAGAPTITFSGGSPTVAATATSTIDAVSGFTILITGSGYNSGSPPSITIAPPSSGTTATATVTVGYPSTIGTPTWSSPNIYVSNPGTGTGNTNVTTNSGWLGYGNASSTGGGPYQVSPANAGVFTTNVLGYSYYVVECVTSAPHCLKTGQNISISGTGSFTTTNGIVGGVIQTVSSALQGSSGLIVLVTDINKFLVSQYNNTSGAGLPGNVNHVVGSNTVSYTANLFIPDIGTIPHETAATIASGYPGCNLWTNFPWACTDLCATAIMTRTLNNFVAGRQVYPEYANEHWNNGAPTYFYLYCAANLGLYSSASIANGNQLTLDQVYAQRTAQLQVIAKTVFTPSGRESEIFCVFGTNWGQPIATSNMIAYANSQSPVIPINGVCGAAYYDNNHDVVDPTTALKVTNTGSSAGSLQAGKYYVYNTFVDSLTGVETTVGSSVSAQFTISAGNTPEITNLAIPAWGNVTANIYLTPPNGIPGTEVLYLTGQTSATVLLSNAWASAASPPSINLQPSTTVAAAMTATHWPTSIAYLNSGTWSRTAYMDFWRHVTKYNIANNYALQHQLYLNGYTGSTIPQFLAYECDYELPVPPNIATADDPTGYNLGNAIAFDMYYDPSTYDWEMAFFQFCQQYGMQSINPFFLCGNPFVTESIGGDVELWIEAMWQSQAVGKGDGSLASNGLDITNQSWVNIQSATTPYNVSVRLAAWQAWADAANSFIVPTDISVSPLNGATGVSPLTVVTVQFNEQMLASTINTSSFTLSINSVLILTTVSYNSLNQTATLTPTNPLTTFSSYIAQVTTSVTNIGGTPLQNPITWTFTTGGTAAGIVLSGPTTDTIFLPIEFLVTISTPFTGTVTPSDSTNSGAFFPEFLYWNNADNTQGFTYVPGTTGNRNISIVSNPVMSISGSPITVSVSPTLASSLVLTGPVPTSYLGAIALQVGVPSGIFTVTPNGLYTGTVLMSDSSDAIYLFNNGTFSPSILTFNNSTSPQTFTYTANTPGTKVISISASVAGVTSSQPIYALAK